MKVTVALPVFNGGVYLRAAIESILIQCFQDWELLVLDDGSTDHSLDSICNLNDSRIRVVSDGLSCGIASRLNQAVSLAKGQYFARMDHDDIMHPERLLHQVSYLDLHPHIDLVATRCVLIDQNGCLCGAMPFACDENDLTRRPWLGFNMAHPSWMGRLQWFENNPYRVPSPYRCEDQELLLRAYSHSRYLVLDRYLMAYRVRTEVPLISLVRTRFSLLKCQALFFIGLGRPDLVALSGSAALFRLASDLRRKICCLAFGKTMRQRGILPRLVSDEWSSILRLHRFVNWP